MKMGHRGSIRRDLGQLFEGQSVAGMGEAQLLDRFVERHDEPAFAALVARHGPMVLGVCRRLLADPLDVEDAFQATFLIFIRRASSIQRADRLAPWLFGVARKVASRTRTDLIRRRARESPGVETIATAPEGCDPELNQALLEEIDRLPDSLREPILLCCVEGLSYEDAATRMQSTAPAVRGRLARGRERLRERLNRRGFAPSVVAGGFLGEGVARASVPAKLLMMTTQLAQAGTFPASVQILAEGVIRTMIVTQSKFLATLLAFGLVGSGVGVYAQRGAAPEPAAAPSPTSSADAIASDDNRIDQIEQKLDRRLAVLTQKGTEPKSDDDRLDKLEKKLDRVLDALEGNGVVRFIPRNSARTVAPRTATATSAAPAPPVPPTPPPGIAVRTQSVLPGIPAVVGNLANPPVPPTPPAPPTPVQIDPETGRPIGVRGGGDDARAFTKGQRATPAESRIEALEQKVGRLEARIAELERKLAPAEESDVRSTTPNRGNVPPPDVPGLEAGLDGPASSATETSPFEKSGSPKP